MKVYLGFPLVRIRKTNRFGIPIDGEMLWSSAVYELFNARESNCLGYTYWRSDIQPTFES